MANHYDIFFSYSRHDKHVILPMLQLLRAAGSNVFLDVDAIKPGKRWPAEIKEAIRDCQTFVVFWCCHSAYSEFVANEIVHAMQLQHKCIIPIVLCDTSMPDYLGEYQWIDLREMVRHTCGQHAQERASSASVARALKPKLTAPERLETIWQSHQKQATPDGEELLSIDPLGALLLLGEMALNKVIEKSGAAHPAMNEYDAKLVGTAILQWAHQGSPSSQLLEHSLP